MLINHQLNSACLAHNPWVPNSASAWVSFWASAGNIKHGGYNGHYNSWSCNCLGILKKELYIKTTNAPESSERKQHVMVCIYLISCGESTLIWTKTRAVYCIIIKAYYSYNRHLNLLATKLEQEWTQTCCNDPSGSSSNTSETVEPKHSKVSINMVKTC